VPAKNYEQLPGEHVQSFAWRIQQSICENYGEEEVPEERLYHHVFNGLHPSIKKRLPLPHPETLAQVFYVFDVIAPLLPQDDDFRKDARAQRYCPPVVTISPKRDDPAIRVCEGICYRCGKPKHFAWQCDLPRNPA